MRTNANLAARAALITVMAAAVPLLSGSAALAQKGEPAPPPSVDCSKKENQRKPACRNKKGELSDSDLFYAGYWLARKGDFRLALHYLRQARNKDDVRILTYTGYVIRKLGRLDEAMQRYERALMIDPDYTVARAYLGEAHLQRGERAKAREQLEEIARRSGVACEEYKELAAALARASAHS